MNAAPGDRELRRGAPPLSGLRVLDLTRVFAGPVAGRTLSDLGADVVKVEPPDGDVTRLWGRKAAGLSSYFTQQNCGKRNIGIDLAHPHGPALVARLAAAADVVVENFRPGVMARFGLDWASLSAATPSLIMLSISGFGQSTSESQRAAYAPIIHAEAGVLPPVGGVDGVAPAQQVADAVPDDIALSAADVLSGLHGVIGVLAALRVRDATGIGQHVDMAMMDAMTFSNDQIINALDDGVPREHVGGEVWPTAAGPMMLTGGLRWIWHQMSTVHGVDDGCGPDVELDEKLTARRRAITEFLSALPNRAAVVTALDAANLAWGDLRSGGAVLASPTLAERDSVARIDDRAGGERPVIRAPYRMTHSDTSAVGVAPFRGEHNAEVLREWLALSDEEIAAAAPALHSDEWADRLHGVES